MKKLALATAALALLMAATPLMARPRHTAVCRVVHPAYYYQSLGRRAHLNYNRSHFRRFHAARYNYRSPYRYRYQRYPYRDSYRDYNRGYRYVPRYRRGLRRPRVGIYLEF